MQAGPSRRVVGLPSNPRQGRVLIETTQPTLAPAPVRAATPRSRPASPQPRRAATPRSRPASPQPRRAQVAASPPPSRSRTPAPRVAQSPAKNPRTIKLPANPRAQSESKPSRGSASPDNEPRLSDPSSRSLRNVAPVPPQEEKLEEPMPVTQDSQGSLTAPIWSTVASVANIASTFTLNVRIPWSSDSIDDGPATPVGTESRLTRAMKSYHLSKAQTHKDLPDWLFTDKERRSQPTTVAPRTSQSSDEGEVTTTYQLRAKPMEGIQGNREGGFPPARPAPSAPARSLGSERLKALRERRRFEAGM